MAASDMEAGWGKMIELGDRARDRISGFEGIVTARSEYLNGCKRYQLEATTLNPDKTLVEPQWFDAQQVKFVMSDPMELFPAPQTEAGPLKTVGGPPIHGDAPSAVSLG